MFIDASVTPARASRIARLRLKGRRAPNRVSRSAIPPPLRTGQPPSSGFCPFAEPIDARIGDQIVRDHHLRCARAERKSASLLAARLTTLDHEHPSGHVEDRPTDGGPVQLRRQPTEAGRQHSQDQWRAVRQSARDSATGARRTSWRSGCCRAADGRPAPSGKASLSAARPACSDETGPAPTVAQRLQANQQRAHGLHDGGEGQNARDAEPPQHPPPDRLCHHLTQASTIARPIPRPRTSSSRL